MRKYWHGSHTTHRNMYHIVWLPKYRKKILAGKVKARLEEFLRECAEINGWEIQELNVQLDHIHLAIQLPPSIRVSWAVQKLKGASSRIIREELPDEIKKYLWGADLWADGYFCETYGSRSEDKIREYIKNQ
jgi:putative transposase